MSFAPVPVPRSSGLRNMEGRYAVRPGRVIPAIQVASSGGSTTARPTGSPHRMASHVQSGLCARFLRVASWTSSGVAGRGNGSAEVRVVVDHTELKLDHLVQVSGACMPYYQVMVVAVLRDRGGGPPDRDHGEGLQSVALQGEHPCDVARGPGDSGRRVVGCGLRCLGQVG